MSGNDAFLWYNVGDWGRFGLAIPNFSNDTKSQNDTIRYLTDVVGRNLQAILWHPDARLRTPPSINTLTRSFYSTAWLHFCSRSWMTKASPPNSWASRWMRNPPTRRPWR